MLLWEMFIFILCVVQTVWMSANDAVCKADSHSFRVMSQMLVWSEIAVSMCKKWMFLWHAARVFESCSANPCVGCTIMPHAAGAAGDVSSTRKCSFWLSMQTHQENVAICVAWSMRAYSLGPWACILALGEGPLLQACCCRPIAACCKALQKAMWRWF